MELEFKGGNCVIISHKKSVFVTDPKLSQLGLKDQGQSATALLLTQERFAVTPGDDSIVISGPGEYEVSNCSIVGVAAQPHLEVGGDSKATIYRFELDDITVGIIGHITPKLSEEQLEALGVVDVLIVPVGDHGYTLDPKAAVAIVRDIDPKVVIPTRYAEEGVHYEVPQAKIEEFTSELSAPVETIAKLKLKAGQLPEGLTVYQLTHK